MFLTSTVWHATECLWLTIKSWYFQLERIFDIYQAASANVVQMLNSQNSWSWGAIDQTYIKPLNQIAPSSTIYQQLCQEIIYLKIIIPSISEVTSFFFYRLFLFQHLVLMGASRELVRRNYWVWQPFEVRCFDWIWKSAPLFQSRQEVVSLKQMLLFNQHEETQGQWDCLRSMNNRICQ